MCCSRCHTHRTRLRCMFLNECTYIDIISSSLHVTLKHFQSSLESRQLVASHSRPLVIIVGPVFTLLLQILQVQLVILHLSLSYDEVFAMISNFFCQPSNILIELFHGILVG